MKCLNARSLSSLSAALLGSALALPAVSAQDCASLTNSVEAEPSWYAAACLGGVADLGAPSGGGSRAVTDTAFAQGIGFSSLGFFSHEQGDLSANSSLDGTARQYFSMDFDPAAARLFAIDFETVSLVEVSLVDGSPTIVGPLNHTTGFTPTGLASHPVTGDWYFTETNGSISNLYSIDITTGVTTLIGATGIEGAIDISINCEGEMYAHDIITDQIFSVDPTTAVSTVIGPTGLAANFAQGMDFDNDTGELYAYVYTGGGTNTYGAVDLLTGAVTPLNVDDPLGEFTGASQTVCPASVLDVPTVSGYGVAVLIGMLAALGWFGLRRL